MARRPVYSQHALQRFMERDIRRAWVLEVLRTAPRRFGRDRIHVLSADALARRFGQPFAAGLRVVVDSVRMRVVTASWCLGV